MIAESIGMVASAYNPMFEAEDDGCDMWSKQTVQYILRKAGKIRKGIRCAAHAMRKTHIQEFDVDEIYQQVLEYFAKYSDYDPLYGGQGIMPIEGYVSTGIKNCVKRFYTEEGSSAELSLDNPVGNDSTEALGNIIPDQRCECEFDRVETSLPAALKSVQYLRGRFGVDLYTMLYVSLKTANNEELRREILTLLGGNRDCLEAMMNEARQGTSELHNVIKALAYTINEKSLEEAIGEIRRYVPSADSIDAATNFS